MLAVLIDAIRALERQWPTAPRIQLQRAWLRDRAWVLADDFSVPFSFVNICGALGIDADYVRRCVLHRPAARPPMRRYAAKAEESWLRQRRPSWQRRNADVPQRMCVGHAR